MHKIKWLFKDELSDDGEPLSSPYPPEPGPGSWSAVDTGSDPPEFKLFSWAELSAYNDAYQQDYLESHPEHDQTDLTIIFALHNPLQDYLLKLIKASNVYGDMHRISMFADNPGVWHFEWQPAGSDDVRHHEIHHDELTPDSLAILLSN